MAGSNPTTSSFIYRVHTGLNYTPMPEAVQVVIRHRFDRPVLFEPYRVDIYPPVPGKPNGVQKQFRLLPFQENVPAKHTPQTVDESRCRSDNRHTGYTHPL